MQKFVARCRDWQRENTDWELICDIPDSGIFYLQWSELPKAERMSWIGRYGSGAKDAFEEFGIKTCKIECKVLDYNLNLHNISDWPHGDTMMVFHTKNGGVPLI